MDEESTTGELLIKLLRRAKKTECVIHADFEWNDLPAYAIVAVGANVGIVKRLLAGGGLVLNNANGAKTEDGP